MNGNNFDEIFLYIYINEIGVSGVKTFVLLHKFSPPHYHPSKQHRTLCENRVHTKTQLQCLLYARQLCTSTLANLMVVLYMLFY